MNGSWKRGRSGQDEAGATDASATAVRGGQRRERRPAPPLDAQALEALALRYVERFATTKGKLSDYLKRKIRERGWDGAPADVPALADRFAQAGYVDDRGYAEMKTSSLARRGYGERRITAALHAARVSKEDAAGAVEQARDGAFDQALAFARRKRIGPFATVPADPDQQRKQLAAMLRAGHSFAVARKIVHAKDIEACNDD